MGARFAFIGGLFLLLLSFENLSFAMKVPPDCVDVAKACKIKGAGATFKDECGRMVQCVGSPPNPKRSREACSIEIQVLYNFKKKAYNKLCDKKRKELYAK